MGRATPRRTRAGAASTPARAAVVTLVVTADPSRRPETDRMCGVLVRPREGYGTAESGWVAVVVAAGPPAAEETPTEAHDGATERTSGSPSLAGRAQEGPDVWHHPGRALSVYSDPRASVVLSAKKLRPGGKRR
jgi:hypothetical protein